MTGPTPDDEPPEHLRYARYLEELEAVADSGEFALVAAVLEDEDALMAESAVCRHLDRRAERALTDAAFADWSRGMAAVVADRAFLARRLGEWGLLRALALDEPWAAEELTGASDWFQRTVTTAPAVTSRDALGLLAARGRTRRIRNAASLRLRQPNGPR